MLICVSTLYNTIVQEILYLVQHIQNGTIHMGSEDHHKLPCLHKQSLGKHRKHHHRCHCPQHPESGDHVECQSNFVYWLAILGEGNKLTELRANSFSELQINIDSLALCGYC